MLNIGKQVQAALRKLVARVPPLAAAPGLAPDELARHDVPEDLDEAIDAAARRIAARRIAVPRIAARPHTAVSGGLPHPVTEPPPSGFWGWLNVADRTAWLAASTPRVLPAGTRLCEEGAPATEVYVLAEGWCKVYATDARDGGEVMLALRGPGDILGEAGAVQGGRRSATVLALTRVQALAMPAVTLRGLLRDQQVAVAAIRKVTEERVVEAAWRMSSQATTTGPQRLARVLLSLADRYPPAGPATRPPLALREHDLASWAGTSEVCAARTLATWRSDGLIGGQAQHVTAAGARALRAIADSGEQAMPVLAAPAASQVIRAAQPGTSFGQQAWFSFGRQHADLLQHLDRIRYA